MSDKPLSERLQVKHGRSLAVVDPPKGARLALDDAPSAPPEAADVVLVFVHDRRALDAWLEAGRPGLRKAAILWLAYPKLTSPLAGDLNRDVIHTLAPSHGLDTVSQIAVDEVWSAMRLKRLG